MLPHPVGRASAHRSTRHDNAPEGRGVAGVPRRAEGWRAQGWRAEARTVVLLAVLLVGSTASLAQDPESNAPAARETPYVSLDAMRRGAPLDTEPAAAPMARVENADLRRQRGWPEQPPTIPHSIDGYHVDKNSNRCMLCHSRAGTERFQAPMVSVTHFMDRDGQVLAQISARRYFCTQCHVVQTDARPLVGNDFLDVDAMLARPAGD
jgi:cytochrome c-type protein NapB